MTELPPIERRITLRMLAYWEKLREGRDMPGEHDINRDDIADLWDSCFLIHTRNLREHDYNYTYLGQKILDAYEHGLSEDSANGIVSPNASKLSGSFSKVMEENKPLTEEGEFTCELLGTVKYRQCFVPLGEHGQVDAILGGMHFKIFPVEALKS